MKYIILFFALLFSFTCKADLGTCYCVKAEIEFEDGFMDISYFKIGGYDFYIEKQENQFVYSTKEGWVQLPFSNKSNHDFELYDDPGFSKNVLNLIGDTLKYYTDYIRLNYKRRANEHQEIELIGEQLILAKNEIKKLNIQRLMPCGVGTSVLTQLEPTDKEWIGEVLQVDYLGGPEMCGYSSFQFKTPTEEVIKLQSKLKEILQEYREVLITPGPSNRDKARSLQKNINNHVELLKKQQVVVMMSCSC